MPSAGFLTECGKQRRTADVFRDAALPHDRAVIRRAKNRLHRLEFAPMSGKLLP